jgi:hypothetical protein
MEDPNSDIFITFDEHPSRISCTVKNVDTTMNIVDLIELIIKDKYAPSSIWTLAKWDRKSFITTPIPELSEMLTKYKYWFYLTHDKEIRKDIIFIYALLFTNAKNKTWNRIPDWASSEVYELLLTEWQMSKDADALIKIFINADPPIMRKILNMPAFKPHLINSRKFKDILSEDKIIDILPDILAVLANLSDSDQFYNLMSEFTIPAKWFRTCSNHLNKMDTTMCVSLMGDEKNPLLGFIRDNSKHYLEKLVNGNILGNKYKFRAPILESDIYVDRFARYGICIVDRPRFTAKLYILRFISMMRAIYFIHNGRQNNVSVALISALICAAFTSKIPVIFNTLPPFDRARVIYGTLFGEPYVATYTYQASYVSVSRLVEYEITVLPDYSDII